MRPFNFAPDPQHHLYAEQRVAAAVLSAAVHDLFNRPLHRLDDKGRLDPKWSSYLSSVQFFFNTKLRPLLEFWLGLFPGVDPDVVLEYIHNKYKEQHDGRLNAETRYIEKLREAAAEAKVSK